MYQGSSNIAPTFTAIVENYYSGNTTLVIKSMNGSFDSSANVQIENVVAHVTTTTANVGRIVNSNTSDVFSMDDDIYCSNNQVFMKVIGFLAKIYYMSVKISSMQI